MNEKMRRMQELGSMIGANLLSLQQYISEKENDPGVDYGDIGDAEYLLRQTTELAERFACMPDWVKAKLNSK